MPALPPPHVLQHAIETRFVCHRCGHCCKGDGLVQFGPLEADRMADHLGLSRRQFLKQFALRVEDDQWILRDRFVQDARTGGRREQWCIFLERDADGRYGCRVNPAKPDQCGSFPAQWRNPDSLQTCVGLRRLLADLKAEPAAPKAP